MLPCAPKLHCKVGGTGYKKMRYLINYIQHVIFQTIGLAREDEKDCYYCYNVMILIPEQRSGHDHEMTIHVHV